MSILDIIAAEQAALHAERAGIPAIDQAEDALRFLRSVPSMTPRDQMDLLEILPSETGMGLTRLKFRARVELQTMAKTLWPLDIAGSARVRSLREKGTPLGSRWTVVAAEWEEVWKTANESIKRHQREADARSDALDDLYWSKD